MDDVLFFLTKLSLFILPFLAISLVCAKLASNGKELEKESKIAIVFGAIFATCLAAILVPVLLSVLLWIIKLIIIWGQVIFSLERVG